MAEKKQKEKLKRKRVNPTIRWGERVTMHLIMKVMECVKDSPESFEKPTARRFYERLASGSTELHGIPWACMREKMRHSRNSYIAANTWKQHTGAALLAHGNEKSVVEYMQRKCPHYQDLHKIFGKRESIKFEEILFSDHDESTIKTPLPELSPEDGSEFSFSTDHSLSASCEYDNQTLEELPESSPTVGNNEEDGYKEQPKFEQTNNSALSLFMMMQQEKMKLKREKFKWQKQKEQQKLDNHFKMKQMELEQNGRLKKLEIELKYRKNNGNN